jgi:hypothetical protein
MDMLALWHPLAGPRFRCETVALYQSDFVEVISHDTGGKQAGQTTAYDYGVTPYARKIAISHETFLADRQSARDRNQPSDLQIMSCWLRRV